MKLKLLALAAALMACLFVISCHSHSPRTDAKGYYSIRLTGSSYIQPQGSVTRLQVDQCYVLMDAVDGFHASKDSDEDTQLEKRTWLRVNLKETDDNGKTWYKISYRGPYATIQEAYIVESDANRQLDKLVLKGHPWCFLLERAVRRPIVVSA